MEVKDINRLLRKVKKFIKDNGLDFDGTGSDLNGTCVILAGYISYLLEQEGGNRHDGEEIIFKLSLSPSAATELDRVFDFAYDNCYEIFWNTKEAREQYVF